mgnify:CR=1 FL=1
MKYKKIAILSGHSNSIIYKRRILPLEKEGEKYGIVLFKYSDDMNNVDITIIQGVPNSMKQLRNVFRKSTYVVFDIPDYLGNILNPNFPLKVINTLKMIIRSIMWFRIHPHIVLKKLIKKVDLVITGSEGQLSFLKSRYNKKGLNLVDPINKIEFSGEKKEHKKSNQIKIIWDGTTPSFMHFKTIINPLKEINKKHEFKLVIFTDEFVDDEAKLLYNELEEIIDVEHVYWDEAKFKYEMLDADIAIAPIDNSNVFNYNKPYNKLLLYWAFGLPVVCSNIPSYKSVMNDDKGFCCENDDDWIIAITSLLEDCNLREEMGDKGYRFTWKNHTQEIYANKYFKALNELY